MKGSVKSRLLAAIIILALLMIFCVVLYLFCGADAPLSGRVDIVEASDAAPEFATETPTVKGADAGQSGTEVYYTPYSPDINGEQINFIYIYGNTAYEYYNFVESTADNYISAVNEAASSLPGTDVYCMVIPTSMGVVLDRRVFDTLPVSDQARSEEYILGNIGDGALPVHVYDELYAHKNEYLYFRTDHHWTALGAYYAYASFMNAKNESARPLSDFEEERADGYLGSFYRDTQSEALEADSVFTYSPRCNYSFSVSSTDESGFYSAALVADAKSMGASSKYLAFIGGDNALSLLENHDNAGGKTLVIVKDSFGNALVPFFADDYARVYVIDFRYFQGDITDFTESVGANELLIASNMSMTRNAQLVTQLSQAM